jgi:hypothetical protein
VSALDRLLVGAAVAVSPAPHRAVRREQWAADVRDAHELDLSPTALAFGALTTALFHRRAGHRSTWGDTMTTAPLHVRPAPHTIRTVPVLIALAVMSYLVASGAVTLLQRYNGVAEARPLFDLVGVGLAVIPGIAVAAAVLLTSRVPLRRRALGAVVVVAVAAVWWAAVTGALRLPVDPLLTAGVIAAAWLGVWFVVLGRPRWAWTLLALPVLAAVLVFPLTNAVMGSGIPYSAMALASLTGQLVPFAVAIVGAVVAGNSSTDAPAVVGQHPEALVDKTV